jgi:hypothetical protein
MAKLDTLADIRALAAIYADIIPGAETLNEGDLWEALDDVARQWRDEHGYGWHDDETIERLYSMVDEAVEALAMKEVN